MEYPRRLPAAPCRGGNVFFQRRFQCVRRLKRSRSSADPRRRLALQRHFVRLLLPGPRRAAQRWRLSPSSGARGGRSLGVRKIGKINNCFAKFCKCLAGSFSAVSKQNFARKYAFDSIFQALQDLHPFAPLQSQNFRKKSV